MTKLATVFCLTFLCTAAHAQDLVVEREVPRGYRLVFNATDGGALLDFQIPEKFDLNDDGSPDLVMIGDDAQGIPQEMVVVDVALSPPEVLWTLDLSAVGGALDTKFHGFFTLWDFEGQENRAAVFGEEGVQIFRPDSGNEVVFSLDADHLLLGVVDIDNDGLYELIIDNKVGGFEVWGAGAAGPSRR